MNLFAIWMKKWLGYEPGILSEISDEIVDAFPSMEFIEAYKTLAKKYPEETEKYHIADFIRDAEKSVKYSLAKGDYLWNITTIVILAIIIGVAFLA